MSPREISTRLRYEIFTSWERTQHRFGRLASNDRLERALIDPFTTGSRSSALPSTRPPRPAFFASLDDLDALRAVHRTSFRAEADAARTAAESAHRHELSFFGSTFRFGSRIPWHDDPVTGASWPQLYHRDMPIQGGDRGYGDVKYVWELNRHQFLVDLARHALLEGDVGSANEVVALVKDWMAAVPYATGAPWACALEPAFRSWSWLFAYHMLRAGGFVNDEDESLWMLGFLDHGRFLFRHLETYSSPYNHLVGEASALYALGVMFPELGESAAWRTRGRAVLEGTASRQFHVDGGTVEQSTFYHHATLGFYLLAAILGRRDRDEFADATWNTIERALEFSAALMSPDGRVPAIGGADDGKPIRFERLRCWDFRPYLAVGAVLFSRPDFKFVAGRFWEDALWLLGPAALEAFEALPSKQPETCAVFPSSGYSAVRSEWSSSADYLCFDCGPQADGLRRDGVSSAAHGHADCLSIVVALGGQSVLVDSGFYCYNGEPEWETHFRRTQAHNTAIIDGADQAKHIAKMDWSHTYQATLEGVDSASGFAWARGSHDGYAAGRDGVVHRRAVWLRDGGYVLIYDEFIGEGDHSVTLNFQFAPGDLAVSEDSTTALFAGRFELAWLASSPVTTRSVCGGSSPADGWIAESLGVCRPAPNLRLQIPLAGGRASFLAILADRRRLSDEPRVELEQTGPSNTLAARVSGRKWEDLVIATTGDPSASASLETDAVVGVVRVAGGSPGRTDRIGGTYLRVRGGPAVSGSSHRQSRVNTVV